MANKQHPEFPWCPQCAYFHDCYERGPAAFLEPACGEGPVPKKDGQPDAAPDDEEEV